MPWSLQRSSCRLSTADRRQRKLHQSLRNKFRRGIAGILMSQWHQLLWNTWLPDRVLGWPCRCLSSSYRPGTMYKTCCRTLVYRYRKDKRDRWTHQKRRWSRNTGRHRMGVGFRPSRKIQLDMGNNRWHQRRKSVRADNSHTKRRHSMNTFLLHTEYMSRDPSG